MMIFIRALKTRIYQYDKLQYYTVIKAAARHFCERRAVGWATVNQTTMLDIQSIDFMIDLTLHEFGVIRIWDLPTSIRTSPTHNSLGKHFVERSSRAFQYIFSVSGTFERGTFECVPVSKA